MKKETMKALAIDKQKKMKVVKIDKPQPNGNDVIVKVLTCGICGSDIHYWEAGMQNLVMGHEYCGEVVDAGSRTDLKVGDRVTALPISPCLECDACKTGNIHYCANTWTYATGLSLTSPGGFAEYMAIRPDMVRKVPKNISDEEVAMVEPTAVALHAVHVGNVEIGDKVLVVGGGIIGLMCAEIARLQGASQVVMTETNPARGEFAVKAKAVDKWFNALDKDVQVQLKEASNGGFDKVFDCCGNSPAITSAIQACRAGGTVVLVGVSLGAVTVPLTMSVMAEQKLLGVIAYTAKEFDECINLIAKKRLNVKKYISKVVGLSAGQKSFETLTSGKDSDIKIILKPELKK